MEILIISETLKDYDHKINEQGINFLIITKEIRKVYLI
jgi:hypothetical protein